MYFRLRADSPRISGKAARRSWDRRSMILAPQPERCCRSRIARPTSQYNNTSASFAASTTPRRCVPMRRLISLTAAA